MNEIIAPFSYADLPAPVAAEVEAVTTRIKARLTRQVSDIIATGRDLLDVKSKLDHGQFESWVNTSVNVNMRTAQRFMRAAEWAEGKNDIVSLLLPTTVYLLSAPSTPESAQRQVLDDLKAGKPVNDREVREVVEEIKYQERQQMTAERRKEVSELRKRAKAREEKRVAKEAADWEREKASGEAEARVLAAILVNKLSAGELERVCEGLGHPHRNDSMLIEALATATPEEQREAVKAVSLGQAKDVREVLPETEEKGGKSRRTSAEIRRDDFDASVAAITRMCRAVPMIKVPHLDSKQRSRCLAELRNAIKHIQELVKTIDENQVP